MKNFLEDLETFFKTIIPWVPAFLVACVPACMYFFFTSYSPPLFPGVSYITTALSLVFLIISQYGNPKADGPDQTPALIMKRGTRQILYCSIPLLIIYILLLQFTTLPMPHDPDTRLQLGFGMLDWTLTDTGKGWKHSESTLTATQMLKKEAAFNQDRLKKLWKTWTVIVAGLLLIVLFFGGFLSWTHGFALIAKSIRKRQVKRE